MTPRERVQAFLDSAHPNTKYAAVSDPKRPLLTEDLRAILAANAGYEQLMREAAREAVAEYKRELAKALRERASKIADDIVLAEYEGIVEDLEDGSL